MKLFEVTVRTEIVVEVEAINEEQARATWGAGEVISWTVDGAEITNVEEEYAEEIEDSGFDTGTRYETGYF